MSTLARPPEYHLGRSDEEIQRLVAQARLFEDEARWLFERVDVPAGGRALDVGCGPLGVVPLLAERVGPGGEVVALDRQWQMLTHVAQWAEAEGLGNVVTVLGDAADSGLPRATFDVAHIRLVLVNVANPADVIAEAAALVRPGGALVVQEVDWLTWECVPAHPAWSMLRDHLWHVWRSRGFDPFIGRRLPQLLRDAGLEDVAAMAHAGIDGSDEPYQRLLLSFVGRFRDELVDEGVVTGEDFDRLVEALDRHLERPGTMVVRALSVQAWGRVAAAPAEADR